MNRRIWTGRFSLNARGGGLIDVRELPAGASFLLAGADAAAADASWQRGMKVHTGTIEILWHDRGVTLRLSGETGDATVDADSILVHEPLPDLYRSLNLPTLQPDTRRFWQRLFLLARIPGGAALIRLAARHLRAKA